MLDRRSQLAEHLKLGCFGAGKTPRVMLSEVRGRAIVQVAGWPDSFENVSKRLAEAAGGTPPETFGVASIADTVTVLWAGAERLWFTADDYGLIARFDGCVNDEEAMLLELTDSRTIFRIKGEAARQVLAKGVAVDLHTSVSRCKRLPTQRSNMPVCCSIASDRKPSNFMYRAVMRRTFGNG